MDSQSLFVAGIIVLFILFFALSIFSFVFWILMIVDCIKRNLPQNEKLAWILVLIFLGVIGAVVYYFVVKHK